MERNLSLAEYLGVSGSQPADASIADISDPKEFAEAVLTSREFRQYIVNSLTLGDLPPAILVRIMDLAGWQKPPKRVEHTGADGQPIEVIKIVRVIVDARATDDRDQPVIEAASSVH